MTESPAAGGNFLGFKMTKYIFVKEIQYFRGSNPENFPPYGGSNPEIFPPAAGFSPPFGGGKNPFFPPWPPKYGGGAKNRFAPPDLRNMGGQKTSKCLFSPHMAENETPPRNLEVLSRVQLFVQNHGFRKILVIGTLKINIFTFLKLLCSRCFLQNESKRFKKNQKSRFVCPKRFLAFSVQCVLREIKKLENVDYGQQRTLKSGKSMIFDVRTGHCYPQIRFCKNK